MTEKITLFDSRLREDEYIIWQNDVKELPLWAKLSIKFVSIIVLALLFIITLLLCVIFVEMSAINIEPFIFPYAPLILLMIFQILYRVVIDRLIGKKRYAITNQRVLIGRDGNVLEPRYVSLILMQDAVKTKPRNGKSTINLYDKRSPTGQLPAPIATLNNLSEEDAETAYDLLVKARDLSFEERIEDMGLE